MTKKFQLKLSIIVLLFALLSYIDYICVITIFKVYKRFSMKDFLKFIAFLPMIFAAGCGGFDLPDLTFSDDESPSTNLETSYEVVLDPNYSGYQDDDDLDRKAIEKGAENFAECANSTECNLLWDTAKTWLTSKSKYKEDLKTNSKNLLETKLNLRDNKDDQITFKVSRIPKGKMNEIQIEAKCERSCKNFIHKHLFAFNSYLKNHLLAYQNGVIGYAQVENEMLVGSNNSDNLNIDFDDMSENPQISVLKENESLDKIEVTKSSKKKYIDNVAETLIDDYSCNKMSEINLVKKTRKRELYEVNCIKEVKRMIFDCGPDGCEVLQ